MQNADEIMRSLTHLSSWPWRRGEDLETGCAIIDSHGEEVGCAHDSDDATFIIASPQLVEELLYENRRLRKLLKQKQSIEQIFSRERRSL